MADAPSLTAIRHCFSGFALVVYAAGANSLRFMESNAWRKPHVPSAPWSGRFAKYALASSIFRYTETVRA
jgi:hypothetical protein